LPVDPNLLLHIADDLKPWAEIAAQLVKFGLPQAIAMIKRFQRRYADDAPETRQLALQNGADAARRIRDEIGKRIDRGDYTEEQARKAFQRPDVAKHAQDALLVASQTSDPLIHEELAKLVAERLAQPEESYKTIVLRVAADTLKNLNGRLLRVLGSAFAVLYIQPQLPSDEEINTANAEAFKVYVEGLEETVAPFRSQDAPTPDEFMYLEELGLAKLSSWTSSLGIHTSDDESRSSLLGPMTMQFYLQAMNTADPNAPRTPVISWLHDQMEGRGVDQFGLKAVRLTPVGFVLGYCMYCVAHGFPFKYPD